MVAAEWAARLGTEMAAVCLAMAVAARAGKEAVEMAAAAMAEAGAGTKAVAAMAAAAVAATAAAVRVVVAASTAVPAGGEEREERVGRAAGTAPAAGTEAREARVEPDLMAEKAEEAVMVVEVVPWVEAWVGLAARAEVTVELVLMAGRVAGLEAAGGEVVG